MLQERRKAIEILGFKVSSCRGFKEEYQGSLKDIAKTFRKGLKELEAVF